MLEVSRKRCCPFLPPPEYSLTWLAVYLVWLCPLIGLNTHQTVSMGWFLIWGADRLSVSPSLSVVSGQFSFFCFCFALGGKQKQVLKWLKGVIKVFHFLCSRFVRFVHGSLWFQHLFSLLSSSGTLVPFIGLKDWVHFRKGRRKGGTRGFDWWHTSWWKEWNNSTIVECGSLNVCI